MAVAPAAPAAPAEPEPIRKRQEEHQPERAGFISEFLREASAVSSAHRDESPLFRSTAPLLGEANGSAPEQGGVKSRPRTAAFVPEAPARPFAVEVRFPGKAVIQPFASRPRLAEELAPVKSGVFVRSPKGAGFAAEAPPAPIQSGRGGARLEMQPRFQPLVPATIDRAPAIRRLEARLHPARLVAMPAGQVRAMVHPMRVLAREPRWKPLPAATPTRPIGKIILVLGSFLRRPVRIAGQESLPEGFELRIQPIPFPSFPPRMGFLEERLHRTDRIGFTPP